MSMNTLLQNLQVSTMAAAIGTGTMKFYSGSVPASSNVNITSQVLKATHTLAGFGIAADGVITGNAVADAPIVGTGIENVSFCRIEENGYVVQLPVGVSGTPVIVPDTAFAQGSNSIITSITLTQPA